MNLWPVVCLSFSAVLWAAASVLQFRFGNSIFRNLKPEFWNPAISSRVCKQIGGYKIDAFHLFQSTAIICFSIPAAHSINWHPTQIVFFDFVNLDFIICLVIVGIAWNIFFPVLYGIFSPFKPKQ